MNKILVIVFAAVVISASIVSAAGAASASPSLQLPGVKVLSQRRVIYRCADDVRVAVRYLNTDAGAFAYLPAAGVKLLFVNVEAGSGAKYVAGRYVWWSKGQQAFLQDVTRPEGDEPMLRDCNEVAR